MSDDLIGRLTTSMREKRAAERNDVVVQLEEYLEGIVRCEEERKGLEEMIEALVFRYVADRLSKTDEDGFKMFLNQLPAKLRPMAEKARRRFEDLYGSS